MAIGRMRSLALGATTTALGASAGTIVNSNGNLFLSGVQVTNIIGGGGTIGLAQFVTSKTASLKKSIVGLTFIRESDIRQQSFTDNAAASGNQPWERSTVPAEWGIRGLGVAIPQRRPFAAVPGVVKGDGNPALSGEAIQYRASPVGRSVVNRYDRLFRLNLAAQQKADLVEFLKSL